MNQKNIDMLLLFEMKIGIIGGGQLGKLFIDNLIRNKQKDEVFVYSPYRPLSEHCTWYQGDLNDADKMYQFALDCQPDVITIEIENVSVEGLKIIKEQTPTKVYPDPDLIEMVKDKLTQKLKLQELGFPVAELLFSYDDLDFAQSDEKLKNISGVAVNKLRVGGYDGYGVKLVDFDQPFAETISNLFPEDSLLERKVNIQKELSVIVGRNARGHVVASQVTEMVFNEENKLNYLLCPAKIKQDYKKECQCLAGLLAEKLDLVGILAVEFFLDMNNKIWINEIAPRPHNSGHHSVFAYYMNQHELLLACLTNTTMSGCAGLVELKRPLYHNNQSVIMVNILGQENIDNPYVRVDQEVDEIEWYGKKESKPGRKMGHITTTVDSDTNIDLFVEHLKRNIHIYENGYDVAVIMGSSSDLDVVRPALKVLNDFNITHRVEVVSAHRTPVKMIEFATTAQEKGYKVIIAAAGGAAHLPGMVASGTILPVIGIPVKSSNSIDGWDSLLSIAQMPGGIPVATMALNGAQNAALYAVRILALNNEILKKKLKNYQTSLRDKVAKQNQDLSI